MVDRGTFEPTEPPNTTPNCILARIRIIPHSSLCSYCSFPIEHVSVSVVCDFQSYFISVEPLVVLDRRCMDIVYLYLLRELILIEFIVR